MQKIIFPQTNARAGKWIFLLLALIIGAFVSTNAQAFTVNVVDQNGNPLPVPGGFKWLLEQDNTHDPDPGNHKPVDDRTTASDGVNGVVNNTLSISLHKSHAPVVAEGVQLTGSSTAITTDASGTPLAAGRYFVSVLPFGDSTNCDGTYDMGGTTVTVVDNSEIATVYVRQHPVETAQISVKVFHDIAPTNNAPDIGEDGLAGFTVTLGDMGGDIVADAFGNPLGTEYDLGVLDVDCNPTITKMGTGDYVTDGDGEALVKFLAPNKYAVQVEPPAGEGWLQTTTIEGTKTIDAWVRPNEPPFLVEFGPPFWHAFYGFIQEFNNLPPGGSTITGQVRKGHLSRPPAINFNPGPPPEGEGVGERCIVGLTPLVGGGETQFIGKCEDGTGNFTIPNVAAGTYQIVIWDIALLQIISFNTVITDGINPVDLEEITVPMWFGQQEHYVFFDGNKNAEWDDGESGLFDYNINLRFRDGTIYQAFATDLTGFVPFQAIFPFFRWQVAEVDFLDLQATGLRATNDLGGAVTHDPDGEGRRNPSVATETGPVLTQAYQIFGGQNQRFEWGKANYDMDVNALDNTSEAAYFASTSGWPTGTDDLDVCTEGAPGCTAGTDGEYQANGGISGTVTYAVTRAEDDPRFAAVEEWEPGVPRVQVNLYRDVWCASNGGPAVFPSCPEASPGEGVGDGIPDDRDGSGLVEYADVDNHPLGWSDGGPMGAEDEDRTGANATVGQPGGFDLGDAIRIAHTDSWDDSLPEDCELGTGTPVSIHGTDVPIAQCADGLRTWNQARPGVFDGGFAFGPGDPLLIPGTYMVEAATPPGYKLLKEEDRNVDFGNTTIPAILPPTCVGEVRAVPPYFSFLTQNGDGQAPLLPGIADNEDAEAPFAGDMRPLCDRKKVDLTGIQNAAVEFHLFTDVPKAARAVGGITDDFANELAPGKPQFTEKFSPPWISIAVFDYTGRHIIHTWGDEFGQYNWLAPSNYNINLPTPSGVGPKMNQFCLNYPFMPDGTPDLRHRSQYSTTCYSFNFEAGRVTYLDTPIIRQAAFVGALQTQLDCEPSDATPVIAKVTTSDPAINGTAINPEDTFVIHSAGSTAEVRNPDYPGGTLGDADDPPTEPEFIPRDFGFGGTEGTVSIGGYTFPVDSVTWGSESISVTVPGDAVDQGLASGQLTVLRTNDNSTQVGVTMTVGAANIVNVGPTRTIKTIQGGIDAASDDDLILVDPGDYKELPILYKRVALQGAGAGSSRILASHFSSGPDFTNPLVAWRDWLAANIADVGLLPEQAGACTGPDFSLCLADGQGPGILVAPPSGAFAGGGARIDGFNITLADLGGAIYVNAYADALQISNNKLEANAGNLGGGMRIGNPTEVAFAGGGVAIPDGSFNPGISIHHNQIKENGSLKMGGGIALFKGADNYNIAENNICGNLARSGGGGIAHRGLSDGGVLTRNEIVFNEVFQGNQPGTGLGIGGGGGGIEVAGDPDPAGGLTEGAGDVTIDRNLIQGNLGGSADGGGIALRNVNGQDVEDNPVPPAGNRNQWHNVDVNRNVIVNNVSGNGGAGIGLQDAANVDIERNTIANNDSTATSIFAGISNPPTAPQAAGIVSRPHSAGLAAASGQDFSNPDSFSRNILYENRSFIYDDATPVNEQGGLEPNVAGGAAAVYWDLGVMGAGAVCLSPTRTRLTMLTYPIDPGCTYPSGGGQGNSIGDPGFPGEYFNDLLASSAADEGGNNVQVYYTPLGVTGDYADSVDGVGP